MSVINYISLFCDLQISTRMDMTEDPSRNEKVTDYRLCIVCQERRPEKLIDTSYRTFQDSAYENLLTCIHLKANQSREFKDIVSRLDGIDSEDLKERSGTWHKTCYKRVTRHSAASPEPHDEDQQKRSKGRPSSSGHQSTKRVLRQDTAYDRTKCIFCQPSKSCESLSEAEQNEEILINCRSENKGKEIEEIVEKSQNPVWKIRLSDILTSGDLLSRDIVYHSTCHLKQWEKYIQRPQRKSKEFDSISIPKEKTEDVRIIAADMHFYSALQERIDDGEFISIVEAEELYSSILNDYHIKDNCPSRRSLVRKILTILRMQ